MTRFSVELEKHDGDSITDCQKNAILGRITSDWCCKLSGVVNQFIEEMLLDERRYGILSEIDNYIIVVNLDTESNLLFCIGYPFPIYEERRETEMAINGAFVKVCFHGMELRHIQRDNLMRELAKHASLTRQKHKSIQSFRRALNHHRQSVGDLLLYFDSYRFIGDSILSTYMMDKLAATFNARPLFISRNAKHLAGIYKKSFNIARNLPLPARPAIYVFPDLLDNDTGWIIAFLSKNLKSGIYLFPGKNFFLFTEKNNIHVHELNIDDVFLQDDNIYDYMAECVMPFVEFPGLDLNRDYRKGDNTRVYLHVASSLKQKSLTISESQKICKLLKDRCISVWINAGFNKETQDMASEIVKQCPWVELVATADLSDLTRFFDAKKISLVISPDSSVCHLSAKSCIPTIIIYKDVYWDTASLLSVCAESPLGFCGPQPTYLPILLDSYSETRMLRILTGLIDQLNGKTSDLSESKKFISLLAAIREPFPIRLARTAKELDLEFKIERYYK